LNPGYGNLALTEFCNPTLMQSSSSQDEFEYQNPDRILLSQFYNFPPSWLPLYLYLVIFP